ncbi:MAG: DUF192 domain-containing protein [Opitutales bacterium]
MSRILSAPTKRGQLFSAPLRVLVVLALMVVAGPGCREAGPAGEPLPDGPASTHALTLGDRTIRVELALTERERRRGLMFREALPPDTGMLFVFEQPGPRGFWMKNTPLPLDIGYFTPDGVLREVYPLYPYNLDSVRSRSDDIQFALEMEQGWFARNQIKPGTRLDRDALAAAIREQGHDPRDYGL